MRIVALALLTGAAWAPAAEFGTWKMNPARSTFSGHKAPKNFTVRIEPHPKGQVFTLDKVEGDGRATSSSTILYLDSASRTFEDVGCLGTQSSRRVDSRTVEILRTCAGREWTRFVRRLTVPPEELILDIAEHYPDGRAFEHHLVLEKQSGATEQPK